MLNQCRVSDSDSENLGSNPSSPAKISDSAKLPPIAGPKVLRGCVSFLPKDQMVGGTWLRSRRPTKCSSIVRNSAIDAFRAAAVAQPLGVLREFGNAARPHLYTFGLPLGALDDDPGIRPKLHMHVASKAPWFTITDDLPQIPGEAPASAGQN